MTVDAQRDDTFLGKLIGVAEEVEQDLAHFGEVGAHAADILGADHFEAIAVLGQERLDGGDDFLDHRSDVEVFEVKGHLAGLDLREIEDAVDETKEMSGGIVDAGDVLDVFLAAVGFGTGLEQFAEPDDGGEWRAELMATCWRGIGSWPGWLQRPVPRRACARPLPVRALPWQCVPVRASAPATAPLRVCAE